MNDSTVVLLRRLEARHNDNLPKEVAAGPQRCRLLKHLLLVRYPECGLHIYLSHVYVHDKVYLKLVQSLATMSVISPDLHDADVNIASACDQTLSFSLCIFPGMRP